MYYDKDFRNTDNIFFTKKSSFYYWLLFIINYLLQSLLTFSIFVLDLKKNLNVTALLLNKLSD